MSYKTSIDPEARHKDLDLWIIRQLQFVNTHTVDAFTTQDAASVMIENAFVKCADALNTDAISGLGNNYHTRQSGSKYNSDVHFVHTAHLMCRYICHVCGDRIGLRTLKTS